MNECAVEQVCTICMVLDADDQNCWCRLRCRLDISSEFASATACGRAFQAGMVRGKNAYLNASTVGWKRWNCLGWPLAELCGRGTGWYSCGTSTRPGPFGPQNTAQVFNAYKRKYAITHFYIIIKLVNRAALDHRIFNSRQKFFLKRSDVILTSYQQWLHRVKYRGQWVTATVHHCIRLILTTVVKWSLYFIN